MADRSAASRESTSTTLLDLARQGDQAAWRRLAHLYLPLLLFWCRSLKGLNDQDAEDVVQEVLVAVFSALGEFQRQGHGAFRAWLRRITYNKVEDLRRQQQRQGQLVYLPEADLERMAVVDSEGEENVSSQQDATEREILFTAACRQLQTECQPKTWQAFILVKSEGHSATKVAQWLNMRPGAVRQAVYRLTRRLRMLLGDEFGEESPSPSS